MSCKTSASRDVVEVEWPPKENFISFSEDNWMSFPEGFQFSELSSFVILMSLFDFSFGLIKLFPQVGLLFLLLEAVDSFSQVFLVEFFFLPFYCPD